MKRSLMLISGAVGAVALLGGITYAAYTVNDGANQFGVKITPGELSNDDTKRITLEWGENTVASVSNLEVGSTVKVGDLVLKATGTDSEYSGKLDLALSDLTSYSGTPNAYLYDYLNVDVYEGSIDVSARTDGAKLGSLTSESANHSLSIDARGSSSGVTYSIFVTLLGDVAPYYETVKSQLVYLSFDWNKASNDQEVTTNAVYLYNALGWEGDMYVYAWEGSKQNAAFPGEKMTKIADKLYRYDLLAGYENIIFAGKNGESITYQTENLVFSSSKPYATLVETTADDETKYGVDWSESMPNILADYYITGKIGGVDNWYTTAGFLSDYKMTTTKDDAESQNLAEFKGLTLNSGDEIKAIASKDLIYYGVPGTNGNYECSKDGTYDVYLSKDGHIYVVGSPTTD